MSVIRVNSFIAVKSGYPFAIDDGIKISLPEIITYKHVLLVGAYIGSSIIQLQDGWVTFGGTTEIFSTKTGGEGTGKTGKIQAALSQLDTYLTFFGGVVHIFVLFFFPIFNVRWCKTKAISTEISRCDSRLF